MSNIEKILLTGATGYVGGRLLNELEKGDHKVHCLARRPEYLNKSVGPLTKIFKGDVLEKIEKEFHEIYSLGKEVKKEIPVPVEHYTELQPAP